jgi:tetratricopeptide (TPR) repeat protein
MRLVKIKTASSWVVAAWLAGGALAGGVRGQGPLAPPFPRPNPGADYLRRQTLRVDLRGVRLLEEPAVPGFVTWDDKPLYELRVQLASEDTQRQRRQQQQEIRPGPQNWRATPYLGTGISPLATVPRHHGPARDGGFGAYQGWVAALDQNIRAGRATVRDVALRGLVCYDVGRYRDAVQDFTAALNAQPRPVADWLMMRGLARLALGDRRPALADLDEAVRLAPGGPTLNNRGVALLELGRPDEAARDFEAALRQQGLIKDNRIFLNRARAFSDLGRHARALEDINGVLNSGDPEARSPGNLLAGVVYRRIGQPAKAGVAFDLVLQIKGADQYTAHGGALGLTEMGRQGLLDRPATGENLREAITGEVRDAEVVLLRGLAHHELDQVGPAVADYTKALRLNPRLVEAYVNRAVGSIELGDLDLAERDLAKALELDARDPFALANRGLLLQVQGQEAAARACFAQAAALEPALKPGIDRLAARAAGAPSNINDAERPGAAPAGRPARKEYRAATVEEAVRWFAAAYQAEDWAAVTEALAEPIGPWFRRYYAAVNRLGQAHRRYMDPKNFRAGTFASRYVPDFLQQADERMRQASARQKFTVEEISVLDQEPVGGRGDRVFLTLRVIQSNRLGERKVSKDAYVAVRQRGNWKLLTLSTTRLTAQEVDLLKKYFDMQIARVDRMCQAYQDATQAVGSGRGGNPDLELLAFWKQFNQAGPAPGKTGQEPPGLAEFTQDAIQMWFGGLYGGYMFQAQRGIAAMRQFSQPQGQPIWSIPPINPR